ncbi:MAG: hypothetical protein ACRC62_15830 [Microcoleus sp.]
MMSLTQELTEYIGREEVAIGYSYSPFAGWVVVAHDETGIEWRCRAVFLLTGASFNFFIIAGATVDSAINAIAIDPIAGNLGCTGWSFDTPWQPADEF